MGSNPTATRLITSSDPGDKRSLVIAMVPEWSKGEGVPPSGLIILIQDTSESMVEYNWPLCDIICCRRSVGNRTCFRFNKRSHREETYLESDR